MTSESSPEQTISSAEADTDTTLPDVATAESSTAETSTDTSVKSILDVVKAASAKGTGESLDSEEGQEAVEAPEKKPVVLPDGDPSEEELAKYGRKAQERIRELVSTKKTYEAELAPLREKASELDKVVDFISSRNLSADDLNNVVEIGGMIKNGNYDKALEQLLPVVEMLKKATGKILPPDLSERVHLGYITEQDAAEIAHHRARAQTQAEREMEAKQSAARQQAFQQHQSAVNTSAGAVSNWEAAKQKNDPDWHLKRDRVHNEFELEVRRLTKLPTADETIKLSERVYERVNAEFKKFQPRPTARTAVNGSTSSRAMPEPKSFLDVVNQNLRRS